jgi:hypothetical protein
MRKSDAGLDRDLPLDPRKSAEVSGSRLDQHASADVKPGDDRNPDEGEFPPKPKWMRWKTYQRHVDRYDRYEDILNEGIAELAARFLAWDSKSVGYSKPNVRFVPGADKANLA